MNHIYKWILIFFNWFLNKLNSKQINQPQSVVKLTYIRYFLIKQKQYILKIPYLLLTIKKYHVISVLMFFLMAAAYNEQSLLEFFQFQSKNDIFLFIETSEKLKIIKQTPQQSKPTSSKTKLRHLVKLTRFDTRSY